MPKEIEIVLNELHPAQQQIVDGKKRFNVLTCGRRFGKSALAVDLLSEYLLQGKTVGLWSPTYKDLYELWQEIKHTIYPIIEHKNEQVMQITTITGGKLDCWSLTEPDSGRGRKYHRIIIDEAEKARKLEEAWTRAIRPTLTDYAGDGWFLSTPKFGQTYFKQLHKNAEKDPRQWTSWRFTTYDNPYINKQELEDAKATLDPLVFACEYLAEDVDLTLRPFAYAYDEAKHVKPCVRDIVDHVCLSFDFNVDPLTCIAAHCSVSSIRIFKEWAINSGDIYEMCERIKTDLPGAVFIVTGDATGAGRSAISRGNTNYYAVIKNSLGLVDNQLKNPAINPAVHDSRVLLNSMLSHFDISIDPKCEGLRKDLKYVEVDGEGNILKDRKSSTRKADLLDCLRYLLNTHYPNYLKHLVVKGN